MGSKLTNKQEKFVLELVQGKSQREAYKAAYSTKNMKDKTIDEKASRLFNEGKIRARYDELIDRVRKEAEEECIVSAKEVLLELSKIGFADIGNYLKYRTEKGVIAVDDEGNPVVDYRTIIDLINSEEVDTSVIQEVSINAKGVFTFKLYDKLSALEKIGKHIGMFRDKVELTGKDGGKIEAEPFVQFYLPENSRD